MVFGSRHGLDKAHVFFVSELDHEKNVQNPIVHQSFCPTHQGCLKQVNLLTEKLNLATQWNNINLIRLVLFGYICP